MEWLDEATWQQVMLATVIVSMLPIGLIVVDRTRRARLGARSLTDGTTGVRPARASDIPDFRRSVDDAVREEMGWTDVDVDAFATVLARGGDHGIHAIVDASADDDRLVGVVTTHVDQSMRQAMRLGWWVAPDHRRRGHLGRAARLVVERMLDEDWSVLVECSPQNIASRRVVASLDLTHTGTRQLRRREADWVEGWLFERHPSGDRPPAVARLTEPASDLG